MSYLLDSESHESHPVGICKPWRSKTRVHTKAEILWRRTVGGNWPPSVQPRPAASVTRFRPCQGQVQTTSDTLGNITLRQFICSNTATITPAYIHTDYSRTPRFGPLSSDVITNRRTRRVSRSANFWGGEIMGKY